MFACHVVEYERVQSPSVTARDESPSPSNDKSMFTTYGRLWKFHIGGNMVTNVTNQLFFIVYDVQYIFLFVEFHCI